MTYDTLAYIIKMGGTITFFAIFSISMAYALWPSNRQKFKKAAAQPLHDSDKPEV